MDPHPKLKFNRKEILVRSHRDLFNQQRKTDAAIFWGDIELALLETSLPNDTQRTDQDKSKLCRCLRSCFMSALEKFPNQKVFEVPFYGIQTYGSSNSTSNNRRDNT
jgi:hypothetical protein